MKKNILLCLFVISGSTSFADDEKEVFYDRIYSTSIKTVMFYTEPLVLSNPVIMLNGPTQLHFMFDDLDDESKYYYFSVVQCNYDWTASELTPFEYLVGYESQQITDYDYSFNTNQSYTHYELLFPNRDLAITKSGNYVLKIFLDNDPEQLVITRRFMVVDSRITIESEVHRPLDPFVALKRHEVDFSFRYAGITISNPMNDINVLLLQNFRWDNAITGLKPLFLKPGELDYNYNKENQFAAGKEFRRFDIRSIRYMTDRVVHIDLSQGIPDISLTADPVRSDIPYFYEQDINGKFVPGIQEYNDQNTEADYVWVNFFLPFDYPLFEGKVFLMGKFSDWSLTEEFLMKYNSTFLGYEAKLYMKQGYYEYLYGFLDKGSSIIDTDLIEGDYYETENTYQIFVYFRPFGSRYDELIGYKATDSYNSNK